MRTSFRRNAAILSGIVFLIALGLVFPRVMAFAELAARELRVLWWLILLIALGLWLSFATIKTKE